MVAVFSSLRRGVVSNTASVFTQDGLVATFSTAMEWGWYVDGGGMWAVAPPGGVSLLSVAIDPAEVIHTEYVGGVMLEPEGLGTHGFDDRLVGPGFGPGMSYDEDLAEDLPLAVDHYVDGSPKTIWLYRGQDDVEVGGSYTGAYAIVQITIVSANPGANAIKPPGYYVAGGKPELTTADINYNVFTPLAIPSGAVEPDWTAIKRYHRRPLIQTSKFVPGSVFISVCAPAMTQEDYPAEQAAYTGQLLLGALSDSADRVDLINRVVRDGLEIKAQTAFGDPSWIPGGGFGNGGMPILHIASYFLNDSTMREAPADVTLGNGRVVSYFNEHGIAFIGDATASFPEGKPLFGTLDAFEQPTGPFGDNHNQRDANGVYEPHWYPRLTGTARGGTTTTIQLAVDAANVVQDGYPIWFDDGSADGQTRSVATLGWDNTTKTITVTPAFSSAPQNGDDYSYSNGGWYQEANCRNPMGCAVAVVCSGTGDDWIAEDPGAWLYLMKRWIDEDGKMNPRFPPVGNPDYTDNSTYMSNSRRFFDADGVWVKKFYDTYAASIWPEQ